MSFSVFTLKIHRVSVSFQFSLIFFFSNCRSAEPSSRRVERQEAANAGCRSGDLAIFRRLLRVATSPSNAALKGLGFGTMVHRRCNSLCFLPPLTYSPPFVPVTIHPYFLLLYFPLATLIVSNHTSCGIALGNLGFPADPNLPPLPVSDLFIFARRPIAAAGATESCALVVINQHILNLNIVWLLPNATTRY